ncbi:MFS general substrate transporter [Flagelloscypha sp. PMI_526]|nr:MFS general substrate transporter [Flagelloscypha sp. PMI_526]
MSLPSPPTAGADPVPRNSSIDKHSASPDLEKKSPDLLVETEVGYALYQESKDLEWTEQEEKRIIRKIDIWVLPMFCITQGLAYLDKTALNYGNLFGMKASLHVTGSQFSWFASGFYIGYLIFAEPATWLLQRFHTGKVLGVVVFIWGIVVMTTAACHSFTGALINRIILGSLEACVTPGLGLMTPLWWRLHEQPLRHLSWYCFNGVASIIGGFLAWGLGHATHADVPPWALIFLTFGAITVFWGINLFLFLPDSPPNARFLTHHEKQIAIQRIAKNRTGTKNKTFKLPQVYAAFVDPKTYLLFFAAVAAQIPNGVISNFSSVIIQSFGFNKFQTILLDMPASIVQIVTLVGSGYIAGKVENVRCVMMFLGNVTVIIGSAVVTYAPGHYRWLRLVFFWLTSAASVGFSLSLVMVSSNVGGFTKRQVTAVFTFVGYCIGNIAGPHTLLDSEAKIGYPTATKAIMAGSAIKCGFHVILGIYMYLENRRRDREAEENGETVPEEERKKLAEEAGMRDLTEHENKWFRYVL